MTRIRKEVRKRGFFGWLFLILFYAFNLVMLFWLVSYWSLLSGTIETSEAARVGKTIGGTIGSGVIVFCWGFGAVILGLFAILTRGSKTIIEDFDLDRPASFSDTELRRNIERGRREPRF